MFSGEIQEVLEKHLQFTKERNWDQFQTPKNLCMALSVESAELLEIFLWLGEKQIMERTIQAAEEEIADVFIYLLRVAHVLGIDPIIAAHKKMKKNVQKYPIEKGLKLARKLQVNKRTKPKR